ncbi:cell cycle control protein cwf16, putative (macronuclear) [Tetrahymena thermophila SB210]|uniref:Splicing factor YJU2 n=1 Tax=Tetrahymena thermophila (strain SB210) TaxID=312017 RepID=Q22RN0_TETTS|nr:cell cycle control protein cwf16, putative [Tetrahymena thermophila SB210]EAR88092.1 cell cycle control protein cwf16, putative [Tetrahymena thermophila SB210]|eukprot:XP_001008337.1 cell cycle control protein cwf16, putative [Tetrahymena thermophila SB210]
MAERKVLIKYYPPDFDPSKLIKNKRPLDKQDNVRMMLPMTVRCNTCGNYLYIGTKFNMRKETVQNESYLGIRIYRFYFKCTHCYSELTFKTDPKNHDYVAEFGATRNYEASRDNEKAEEVLKKLRENDEEGNAMKFLENRTNDSRKELEILDALDEIRHNSKKMLYVTPEELIKLTIQNQIEQNIYEELDDDEQSKLEEFLQSQRTKRIKDYNDDSTNDTLSTVSFLASDQNEKQDDRKKQFKHVFTVKKIQKISETESKVKSINNGEVSNEAKSNDNKQNNLQSILNYSSDSDQE